MSVNLAYAWPQQMRRSDSIPGYHVCCNPCFGSSARMTNRTTIIVNDKMQKNYRYELSAPMGKAFADGFKPFYTPQQMLEMGVFEGRYLNDCTDEFPGEWYENAKISPTPDTELNCFGIKSRQPLSVWQQNGWIYGPDPRGWFQWYCRYY